MKQTHTFTAEELGITFNTGSLAFQANGAVTVTEGENTVFVAATAAKRLRFPDQDFFPLTVDYREKFYAAGRFPGGYFKREGRPSEREILTCRLCDRPLRPLFPKGFLNEVQIIGLLLSTDTLREVDVLMVNAASAALHVSDIPWEGPIACVRLAELEGKFIVNPTHEQLFDSALDLIYVGNKEEMMMIEGSAEEMPEERFLEALAYAQEAIQPLIKAQNELALKVGKEKSSFNLAETTPPVLDFCRERYTQALKEAVVIDCLDNSPASGGPI